MHHPVDGHLGNPHQLGNLGNGEEVDVRQFRIHRFPQIVVEVVPRVTVVNGVLSQH